jgi:hypothetical protein
MKEKERELREEVRRLLSEADRQDKAEDRRCGRDRTGEELPEELRRRESGLQRIRQAKWALEEEARQQAQAAGKEESQPEDKMQLYRSPIAHHERERWFCAGIQLSDRGGRELSVDRRPGRQEANDKEQLKPMVEAIKEQAGQKPGEVLADSGYCSEDNLKYLARRRIDGYVATERQKHGEDRLPCKRGPLPKGASLVERMKRKLQTQVGRRIYAMRKVIVEPVFGQIKQVRGFRQFLLRGLEKVQREWALVCLTHNILKLHRIYPLRSMMGHKTPTMRERGQVRF